VADEDAWAAQRQMLGAFIRSQRQLAQMSLRELAARSAVSNPYLSQIERGLHEPSLRVLKAIAAAFGLSADTLLAEAGIQDGPDGPTAASSTASVIRADPLLSEAQKTALLAVYHSYVEANTKASTVSGPSTSAGPDAGAGTGRRAPRARRGSSPGATRGQAPARGS